jgi:asparaginyl-tRNA synthetase
MTTLSRVIPPAAWRQPETHYLVAIDDPWFSLVLQLFDGFDTATSAFWRARSVPRVPIPLTTGAISCPIGLGSDASPVEVTIAGTQTYLTDSQQFPLEFGCRMSHTGCYCIMPSFRGENNDARHLGQFVHSEAELPTNLSGLMMTIEEYLRSLAVFYLENHADALVANTIGVKHVERLAESETVFSQIDFDEAADYVSSAGYELKESADGSWRALTHDGERHLLDRFGDFLWVTHHDELAVPFFQASDPRTNNRRVARNADLLMGIGETVGGGERHSTANDVREALIRHAVSPTEQAMYNWYINLREVKPITTSGFGLGVERFLLWLLGHDDIRDLQFLARAHGQCIFP